MISDTTHNMHTEYYDDATPDVWFDHIYLFLKNHGNLDG